MTTVSGNPPEVRRMTLMGQQALMSPFGPKQT